jgi:hypothetical protein
MWQKAHGTDQLLELSAGMSQEQVRAIMGNPDSIAYDESDITIPRYALYNSHRTADEWPLLFLGGWTGFGTLYPLSPPHDYLLVFLNGQLCNWAQPQHTLDYAAQLLAEEVMKKGRDSYCKKPRVAKYPAPTSPTTLAKQATDPAKIQGAAPSVISPVTVLPVYMPPPINAKINRLAILPLSDTSGYALPTILDLALNILRNHHQNIVLVERDLRPVLTEVLLQYSGRINDESTVRVGRLAGADTLLTYSIEPFSQSAANSIVNSGGVVPGAVEVKLINVEEGTLLFRQQAMGSAFLPAPGPGRSWPSETLQTAHRNAVNVAAGYALVALLAASGNNSLGIVPNPTMNGAEIYGVLEGSAAQRAGLKKGDRVLTVNGQDVTTWTSLMSLSLPTNLTIEREGKQREVAVMNP